MECLFEDGDSASVWDELLLGKHPTDGSSGPATGTAMDPTSSHECLRSALVTVTADWLFWTPNSRYRRCLTRFLCLVGLPRSVFWSARIQVMMNGSLGWRCALSNGERKVLAWPWREVASTFMDVLAGPDLGVAERGRFKLLRMDFRNRVDD